ncbi:hypothetical protein AKJ09_07759 [Labilithrix luteola]|uniref:Uncharacterized protein n=1 Tax=Labilithrix luteola TaxID=1391654 RepID=A0A0K1Q5J1_9BACT|nr:hypothetical protein AKJ09_07759 [Labilithrix luteola]
MNAADSGSTRYDQVIQKSSHNAYGRAEPLFDQIVWHGIRSIELDVHASKAGRPAPVGDWFVYHEDFPMFRDTSCNALSDCLVQLKAFHDAVPDHDVVTVWIDAKETFAGDRTREALDDLLAKQIGRDAIVTPRDLVNGCSGATSVRDAVTPRTSPSGESACSFPTLDALRGKFIFAITGGTLCNGGSPVASYAGAETRERTAFAAPNVDRSCSMASYDQKPDVVFFNMAFDDRAHARAVRNRGLLARIYGRGIPGGIDTAADFEAAQAAGAQHIATDMVNADRDAWAMVNPLRAALKLDRFPFGPAHLSDPFTTFAVRAISGDIWANADDFWFSYQDDPSDAVYQTFVSVPSSHVESFAKGCLVARANTTPGAPNVSVCRTFDGHAPRVQMRATQDGPTIPIIMPLISGVSEETPPFLRMAVTAKGSGSEVVADASVDGKHWHTIAHVAVAVPLPFRGIGVSSHGSSAVRAVFGNVLRSHPGEVATTVVSPFTSSKAIGRQARGELLATAPSPKD